MANETRATEYEITIRCRAFSSQGIRQHHCLVGPDGVIRVWDDIAGYYTTCHSISPRAQRRIRADATPAR